MSDNDVSRCDGSGWDSVAKEPCEGCEECAPEAFYRERERAAIVAWLRGMADRRLEVFADESDCRNEPRNPCLVGAEAFSEAANAIERGGAGPDDRCKPDCDAPR